MRYRDVEWELAACAGLEGRVWFPDKSAGGKIPEIALRICRGCDIREDCGQYALDNGEVGLWGGIYFTDKGEVSGHAGINSGQVHTASDGDSVPEV